MLTFHFHLVFLFSLLGLSCKSGVVKNGIAHKLLFNELHPSHNWSWISLFDDVDVIAGKVNFVFAFFPKLLFCRLIMVMMCMRLSNVILVHNS